MTDLVTLRVKAGDGGHGRVSFRREKYAPKGGPDGGRGGDGGNIIIRGSTALATLNHFAGVREVVAEDGQLGGERKKIGSRGEDQVVEVPVGTVIWVIAENRTARRRRARYGIESLLPRDEVRKETYELEYGVSGVPYHESEELQWQLPDSVITDKTFVTGKEFKQLKDAQELTRLIEITQPGQEVVLCQGGIGGRGNESFKSGSLTTPRLAEFGTPGEERVVILEQRLLADVGLVGFPSVGKSTLLSVVTKARPKIAAYPFTTLEPNLGIMTATNQGQQHTGLAELVLADIPGLIEGASTGKGLGYDFLRHVENTKIVLFVLALDESVLFDETLADQDKAAALLSQLRVLKKELTAHSPEMMEKKQCVSVNKIDIYTEELKEAVRSIFIQNEVEPILMSVVTGEGIDTLRARLFVLAEAERE